MLDFRGNDLPKLWNFDSIFVISSGADYFSGKICIIFISPDQISYAMRQVSLENDDYLKWPTCISLAMLGLEKSTTTFCLVFPEDTGGRTPFINKFISCLVT